MFHSLRLLTSSFFIVLLSTGMYAQADCATDEMIIQLQPNADLEQWLRQHDDLELLIEQKLRIPGNVYLMSWNTQRSSIQAFENKLHHDRQVMANQKNCTASERSTAPNDPEFSEQWNIKAIEADKLWDVTTGGLTSDGDQIVVAVLDSGSDVNHEDLRPNVWQNKFEIPDDFVDNDNNGYIDDTEGWNPFTMTNDHVPNFHGTSVSGIIGAKGNNNIGLAGIGWGTQLMVFSEVKTMAHAMEALYYCYEQRKRYNESDGAQGSFVVATNYSLGFDQLRCNEYPIWDAAYDSLGMVGILSVGATANQNWDIDQLGDIPSSCSSDFLIAVTNVDITDEKVFGAGYGKQSIDLGAPGNGVITTSPFDGYQNFSGTSSATPHVAGAIGLLYSIPCPDFLQEVKNNPEASALAVKSAILAGVDERNSLAQTTVSGGRLNVWNSFRLLEEQYSAERGDFALVNLYPNPTDNLVLVKTSLPTPGDYNYRILDSAGRLIHGGLIRGFCQDKPESLDLRALRNGYYYFQLFNEEESTTLPLIIL